MGDEQVPTHVIDAIVEQVFADIKDIWVGAGAYYYHLILDYEETGRGREQWRYITDPRNGKVGAVFYNGEEIT